MGVRVEVQVTSNLRGLTAGIETSLMSGLNLAAERLLTLSSVEVPLEIGTLQASGTVERAASPDEGSAVVYDTPYAARLHEHPEYNFQGGRKGKYLEDPALHNKDELGALIAAEVRRA